MIRSTASAVTASTARESGCCDEPAKHATMTKLSLHGSNPMRPRAAHHLTERGACAQLCWLLTSGNMKESCDFYDDQKDYRNIIAVPMPAAQQSLAFGQCRSDEGQGSGGTHRLSHAKTRWNWVHIVADAPTDQSGARRHSHRR